MTLDPAPPDRTVQARRDAATRADEAAKAERVAAGSGGDQTPTATLAAALAGLGAFLFLPATLDVFAAPALVFGVPMIWAFLFTAWAALILGAAALARREQSGADAPASRRGRDRGAQAPRQAPPAPKR